MEEEELFGGFQCMQYITLMAAEQPCSGCSTQLHRQVRFMTGLCHPNMPVNVACGVDQIAPHLGERIVLPTGMVFVILSPF